MKEENAIEPLPIESVNRALTKKLYLLGQVELMGMRHMGCLGMPERKRKAGV